MVFLFVLAILGGLWVWLITGQRSLEDIDAAIGGLSGLFLFSTPFVGLYLGSDAGRFDRSSIHCHASPLRRRHGVGRTQERHRGRW